MADGALYGVLKQLAYQNRKNPTQGEALLWEAVKGKQLGIPFRRQHIIGQFIADISCPALKLIIEVDGGYHQIPDQQFPDAQRTAWLEAKGYTTLRFSNEEVIADTSRVIETIKDKMQELIK